MSAAPSEPEKYSIDEMMDRLKKSPLENPDRGELVTRADGSQALRVRKRKRRSSQPQKTELQRTTRSRIVQVAGALFLVFIVTFVISAAVVYANSSLFRKSLENNIANASGADMELTQFRMNPQTANAGTLTLKWPEGNVLDSLFIRTLVAEIFPSSFLGKTMNGEEITVAQANLTLRIPQEGEITRKSSTNKAVSPICFNRYRTPMLEATLGEPATPMIKLQRSEASFTPRSVNGRPQLSLYQGQFSIANWPTLRIDRALIEFRGDETDIIGFRLLHEKDDRGSLEVSGTVSPYKTNQLSSLDVHLEAFELSGIIGSALGQLITGRIDTRSLAKSNFLSFRPSDDPKAQLDISFTSTPSSGMELHGLPFLFAMSQILDDEWFLRPIFDSDSTGTIHREGDVVSLRNLEMTAKGRLSLRGELSITANSNLSGNLQLGMAEAMIASAAPEHLPRLQSVFGPPKEGFRWATIKISGTVTAPVDNFKDLYSAAREAQQEKTAPSHEEGHSSFKELTHPK